MEKNEILKIYGTNYKEMTKALLVQAKLNETLAKKAAALYGAEGTAALRIGIKPNLVTPTPADYGATTHPEVVAGILEYLQEQGYAHITVLEGAWIGDLTSEAFVACGYTELAKQYGVELWDTQKDTSYEKDCGGMTLRICEKVRDIDFLINVPVLKGHCQTKITCALKNSKGLIPNSEKRRFHTVGLHQPIAHLGVGIRQDFIVVDHICGDLDFEEGGNPVVRNCIMVATDPVLMDAYVCKLLQYKVSDVPYVALAEQLGVGCADLTTANIQILRQRKQETDGQLSDGKKEAFSLEKESVEVMTQEAPRHKVLAVNYAVEDVDSCSACYANLIPALDRLQQEGLLEKLDTNIAIGQGYRGKTGRLGVGRCTAAFSHSIKGCPPKEEDIYQTVKNYILNQKSSEK